MGAVRRARPAGGAARRVPRRCAAGPRRRRAAIDPAPIAVPADVAGAARRPAVDPGSLRPHPRRLGGRAERRSPSRIVTTSPDVTVSTNLGAWVNRRGIFDRAERADTFREEKVVSAQRWAMAPQGQHIELGIAESNLFLLLAALGLAGPLFGARLLPIGTRLRPVHQARPRRAELRPLPGFALHPGGDPVGPDAGARGRRAPIGRSSR